MTVLPVRAPPQRLAGIASTTQRLAVLLAAGTAPAAAWGHLGGGPLSAEVAMLAASGETVSAAIDRAAGSLESRERLLWGAVAAAWAVATEAGAPLAPTLDELAGAIRDLVQTQRDIAVALASPTATARLVLLLPVVGLVCSALLGFDTLRTLFATGAGWGCLGVGAGLLLVAFRWNRRMVRAAQPRHAVPGIELDLLAIALGGGGSVDRARSLVSAATGRYLGGAAGGSAAVDEVLDLSQRAGVPAAMLLRVEANERRREARARAAEGAQALSVRLMIPLGLCVLPAFLALTVVPLVLSVLAATSIG